MSVCEKCWGDAYMRLLAHPTKPQAEHYADLIRERKDNPCSKAEQALGSMCKMLRTDHPQDMVADINAAIDKFTQPLEEQIAHLKRQLEATSGP
jgi:hypothetical protein